MKRLERSHSQIRKQSRKAALPDGVQRMEKEKAMCLRDHISCRVGLAEYVLEQETAKTKSYALRKEERSQDLQLQAFCAPYLPSYSIKTTFVVGKSKSNFELMLLLVEKYVPT
ncbi:hypothetical protein [Rufibacter immobilis]|uniref:hypothetical protein n=1 Tax=Rufibacter immobilis TaxID=1348778 RepID=UPI0035EC39E0